MKKFLSEQTHSFDVEVNRNSFDSSKTRNASYNFGYAYPMYIREVHPNESIRIRCSGGFDLKPMIGVSQTHVRCHTAWYYVRTREIWDHANKFHRQDKTLTTSSVAHPVVNTNDPTVFKVGSLAHHLGIPVSTIGVYPGNARVPVTDSSFENIRFPGFEFGIFNAGLSPHTYSVNPNFGYSFLRRSFDSWLDAPSGDVYCHRCLSIPGIVPPLLLGDCLSYSTTSNNRLQSFIFPLPLTRRISDYNTSNPWSFVFHHISRVVDGQAQVPSFSIPLYLFVYVPGSDGFLSTCTRCLIFSFRATPISGDAGSVSTSNVQSKTIYVDGQAVPLRTCDFLLTPNKDCIESIQSLQAKYSSLYFMLGVSPSSNPSVYATDGVFAGNVSIIPKEGEGQYSVNVDGGFYGGFEYQSDYLVNTDVDSPFLGLGSDAKEHVNALPFRAYEAVCNVRFRNRDLDPLRIDGEIAVDKYNVNSGDGLDSTTPLHLFKCQYEDDYFTTCMPSPQGNMFHQPLVGITIASNPDSDMAVATYKEGSDTYQVEFQTDGTGKMLGMNYNSEDADRLTILTLKDAIQYGISLQDLQNKRALSKWYEATYRKGRFSHDEFIGAHFGKVPTSDAMHAPEYLGGDSLPLSTMRVLNNSQADGGILGASGGLGSFATRKDKPGEIECFCDVEGFIIGVCWFSVVPTYGQAMDKMWYRKLPSDYPTPEFANLGTMPVLNKEIAPLQCNWDDPTAADYAGGTFGYQRIYGDLLLAFDDIAGDYADELNNLIMYRKFNKVPTLGVDFVTMSPEDLNNIFVLDDDRDKIYGQWHFDVTCKLWLQQRPNAQIF